MQERWKIWNGENIEENREVKFAAWISRRGYINKIRRQVCDFLFYMRFLSFIFLVPEYEYNTVSKTDNAEK